MRRSLVAVMFIACLLLAVAVPAAAAEPVSVKTFAIGSLSPDRFTATVHLVVRCSPAEGDVLEALVTVSQTQTFGQGGFGPVCDDRWHRISVQVSAFDVPFELGRAQVSSFVLICNAAGECVSGEDTRTALLR
jgi:hypothetical protein